MRRKAHYVIVIKVQYNDEPGTTSLTVVRYDRAPRAKLYTCTEYEFGKTREAAAYEMIMCRTAPQRRPYSTVEHNIALAALVALRNDVNITARIYSA